MRGSLRVLVGALLLVFAIGGLAACGSGGGNESASELINGAFGSSHPVKSGRLGLSLNLTAKGFSSLKGPLSLKLNGPFQSMGKGKLPTFAFDVAVDIAGSNLTAGAVSTGGKAWIKLEGSSYVVTDSLFQQFKDGYENASKGTKKGSGSSLQSLGISPAHWLKNPTKAGDETVGGTDTTHITSGVDVGKLLDDVNTLLGKAGSLGQGAVPTTLTQQQRSDIESSIKSAKLDVWTGKKDKALRQLKVAIAFDVPAATRKRAGGLQSGSLGFTLTISDLNAPQKITPPANAKPLSDLTQALSGATGGATGTTTTPAPATGTATTPAPATGTTTTPATPSGTTTQSSAYLDCLRTAGGDVAKVQKCASLLKK